MNGHVDVQTQEVHTGTWFTVIEFHPWSEQANERAADFALGLDTIGLSARIIEVKP